MASFARPETIRELFLNGMKRQMLFDLPEPPAGPSVNLGSGFSPIEGTRNLDLPEWSAPKMPMFLNESMASVHAYHFFEHLEPDTMYGMMEEIFRVLMPEGLCYYCVPYAMAPIAYMDLTHRTFWTEETMRTLLKPRGYQSGLPSSNDYVLSMVGQVIIGLNSQNLGILGVLRKRKRVTLNVGEEGDNFVG